MNAPSTNDETRNAANFQRSAAEPVTMVSGGVHEDHLEEEHDHDADVVGAALVRKKPFWPNRPKALPNSVMVYSAFSGAVPPRLPMAPTPPIWMAKPISQ